MPGECGRTSRVRPLGAQGRTEHTHSPLHTHTCTEPHGVRANSCHIHVPTRTSPAATLRGRPRAGSREPGDEQVLLGKSTHGDARTWATTPRRGPAGWASPRWPSVLALLPNLPREQSQGPTCCPSAQEDPEGARAPAPAGRGQPAVAQTRARELADLGALPLRVGTSRAPGSKPKLPSQGLAGPQPRGSSSALARGA